MLYLVQCVNKILIQKFINFSPWDITQVLVYPILFLFSIKVGSGSVKVEPGSGDANGETPVKPDSEKKVA